MATKKKLSDQDFMGLLDALGGNQKKLAEDLGISPPAVCKRVKKILKAEGRERGKAAKVVSEFDGRKPKGVRRETYRATEIAIGNGAREVDHKLDVLSMLIESNAILTDLLKEVREEIVKRGKSNPLQRKQLISLADKLQSQAKTYFDIQSTLYNAKMVKHFIDSVLYVISQEAPDLQRAIYRRLRDSGSLFHPNDGAGESSGG